MPKQESHLRSVLKGVSWRLIAFLDTILVVLLITCFFEECSLDIAVKIGFAEFLLKFLVYYIHERLWQFTRQDSVVTKKETLLKSISWRFIATLMTFLITGTVLEAFDKIALYIALTELFTKFVLYYFHERVWYTIPLGKVRKLLKLIKK
jgi:uncharacterized membrane protein